MSRLVALLGTFLLAGCGQAALLSSSPAANTTAPTVGLPSPSAVPSAAFPTNSPTLSPAFEWQALGSVATQSQIRGLAASARGYVLLEGGTTVWFSPDAKKWSRVILPFNPKDKSASKGATAICIAASPTDFIVDGSFSHEPCVGLVADGGPPGCAVTPISWVSRTG